LVLAERTHSLHLHCTFAPEYGLARENVAVFVASHSHSIDYLAPWELSRLSCEIATFGKRLVVDLRVKEPIPRHFYGLAWMIPPC
jgi:hypothetical protein